jgi:hypothetical protein
MQGGVAAKQPEYPWAEEGGVQIGAARDDMIVEMIEALGF